jgi:hypothetical protein
MKSDTKDKKEIKKLKIVRTAAVKCPFNNILSTLERCENCCNFGGIIHNKLNCKWAY